MVLYNVGPSGVHPLAASSNGKRDKAWTYTVRFSLFSRHAAIIFSCLISLHWCLCIYLAGT